MCISQPLIGKGLLHASKERLLGVEISTIYRHGIPNKSKSVPPQ